MRTFISLLFALPLLFAMGLASAQTMTFTGDILIKDGDEFVSASDGMSVSPGQTLKVPPGGSVTVTYPGAGAGGSDVVIQFNAGTYVVPTAAQAVGLAGGASVSALYGAGVTAAIVGAAVVISAAALNEIGVKGDDNTVDTPLCTTNPSISAC